MTRQGRPRSGAGAPRPRARPRTAAVGTSRRTVLWLLVTAGVPTLAGLVLLGLFLLPEAQSAHQWLVLAVSFAPYGWFAWAVAVVSVLIGTRGGARLIAAPLALCFAWHGAVLVPYLPSPTAGPPEPADRVRLLAANLYFGQADLDQLAAAVGSAEPDLLVLTEVTRSNAKAFESGMWSRRYPYRSGTAGDNLRQGTRDARGTMVLSRHPLIEAGATSGTLFSNVAVRVVRPGRPFVVIAAHPAGPHVGLQRWLNDADALTRLALDHADGPLLVAGDLNATPEHLTLRELAAKAGLRDALAGAGWQPTFPAGEWYPPLFRIDQVLASEQFTAVGARTLRFDGTDHLGILVDLALP